MTQAFNRDCMEKRPNSKKTKYDTKQFNYCPKCHTENKNIDQRGSSECIECGHRIDFRIRAGVTPERLQKLKEWCSDKENRNRHAAKSRARERMIILKKIGRGVIECQNCGCDDPRILEINHINGGGTKELRSGQYTRQFLRAIINGNRTIDDLNLLCKVCNIEHYVNLKFGITNFKISYGNIDS